MEKSFCLKKRMNKKKPSESLRGTAQQETGRLTRCRSGSQEEAPCYMNFVKSARLWDRGVYHYINNHPNEKSLLPSSCARFVEHMKTSPPHLLPTKPLPSFKKKNHSKDMLATSRNTWSNSAFSKGQQKQVPQPSPFKSHAYEVPKSPVPSLASIEADESKRAVYVSSPSNRDRMNLLTNKSETEEKKESIKDLELPCDDPSAEDDLDLDEAGTLWNRTSSALSAAGDSHSVFSRSSSSIAGNSASISIGKGSNYSDFSRQVSSMSATYSDNTPCSQLRSSSFSVSSFGQSSHSSQRPCKSSQHKNSLLEASGYCSSIVNPKPNSSSYHGSGDLFQASSYSVKKCSGQAPSFVEIWHDQLLQHWPVLPPISPQREVTETPCDESSQVSTLSNEALIAFDELDEIMPYTGSSLSQCNTNDVSYKDFSPVSEISMQAASLKLGDEDEGKSLAKARLSLLDHCSWDKSDEDNETNRDREWECTQAENTRSKEENESEITEAETLDFVFYPVSTSVKGKTRSNTCSKKEMDYQQSICTVPILKQSSKVCKEGFDNYSSTFVETPSYHNLRRNSSDTELYLAKDYYSPALLPVSKSESKAHKREDSCVKNERTGDSGRLPQPGYETWLTKLNHSLSQEIDHQLKTEERQAQALHIYSKLQKTQLSGNQKVQKMNISKFEDFDFLAKYCIFSQEKLAKYKRAFEAVDTDGDGYLNCLQVLIALKEIVPSEALTDAEELYVYRILEIVDYYVTDGLTDLRLFAVMASLAQKIAALDNFMRSLIGRMDFKTLELKMYNAKQLFLCNIDSQSKCITVQQFLVELKAGGVSKEHEEAVQKELRHVKTLDILDFLTYLPLFVLIHNSVIANPLDDTRTI
ncbi:uncharacterized protein LOC115090504 isoform X2 [Rhinatrema bivittatum]|uniref:uncharacterized protein LOC115090504 isoform X2 n=1 Tax=Rhinatrema bivittatum TaxID=194408 RepID=UPI00112CDDE7|nr:uncharacterized protein LOC115090504 isoform X2 [Rhinatrema bivittatum]XP_029455543.1 uncharacterized protein LOC115090504 isoform X2 [Rhinatrema bivittatum]